MIGADAIGMHPIGGPGLDFSPAVVEELSPPGLEFTLPRRLHHFALPLRVLHFTLVPDDA
jgi:hypothetical protein